MNSLDQLTSIPAPEGGIPGPLGKGKPLALGRKFRLLLEAKGRLTSQPNPNLVKLRTRRCSKRPKMADVAPPRGKSRCWTVTR